MKPALAPIKAKKSSTFKEYKMQKNLQKKPIFVKKNSGKNEKS